MNYSNMIPCNSDYEPADSMSIHLLGGYFAMLILYLPQSISMKAFYPLRALILFLFIFLL